MSRLVFTSSKALVNFSYWVFALWWAFILGVHVVTCSYNALYAYCYWELQRTYLYTCLEFYRVGMPTPHHHTISIVHAVMSVVHGCCIILMLYGSLRQQTLAFTPWSSCMAVPDGYKGPWAHCIVVQKCLEIFSSITAPFSVCGVKGRYFDMVLIFREIVETAMQTSQAYRMSKLLPRVMLNRFYVILLVVNCLSSTIVHFVFAGHCEARRRFECIILDCVLDLVAGMGVTLIIATSYVGDYIPSIQGFDKFMWYNDEWVARALNEFQMVLVVSWWDLASRVVFSLGLAFSTTSMKTLIRRLPRNVNRVASAVTSVSVTGTTEKRGNGPLWTDKFNVVATPPLTARKGHAIIKLHRRVPSDRSVHSYRSQALMHAIHLLFGAWGVAVLGLHVHTAVQPTRAQCLMQVRPWAVSRPSCYLVGLDCHTLNISGKKHEILAEWSEFDTSTAVQLLIRHCPMLEVPDTIKEFHQLRGIKVYNTTINEWGSSSAITDTDHPEMASLFLVRVNMTGGVLPAGFQSTDFPQGLYDIEMCVTNLRELPDDLDTKWIPGSIIQIEYSQLAVIPLVLTRLEPMYMSVAGNPATELPLEIFEVPGLFYLSVSNMRIRELPRNVTLSPTLSQIYILNTDISFFWSWADELVDSMNDGWGRLLARGSTYCEYLEMIENDATAAFPMSLSPEYSTLLMNSSEPNRLLILKTVCGVADGGLLYPLVFEDSISAISTPRELTNGLPETKNDDGDYFEAMSYARTANDILQAGST